MSLIQSNQNQNKTKKTPCIHRIAFSPELLWALCQIGSCYSRESGNEPASSLSIPPFTISTKDFLATQKSHQRMLERCYMHEVERGKAKERKGETDELVRQPESVLYIYLERKHMTIRKSLISVCVLLIVNIDRVGLVVYLHSSCL